MVGNCYYPYFIDEEYKAKEISALPKVTQQHGSGKTAAQIKDQVLSESELTTGHDTWTSTEVWCEGHGGFDSGCVLVYPDSYDLEQETSLNPCLFGGMIVLEACQDSR